MKASKTRLLYYVIPILLWVTINITKLWSSGINGYALFMLLVRWCVDCFVGTLVNDTELLIIDEAAKFMPARAVVLAILLALQIITTPINARSIIVCIITGMSFLYHVVIIGYNIIKQHKN